MSHEHVLVSFISTFLFKRSWNDKNSISKALGHSDYHFQKLTLLDKKKIHE